MLCVILGAKGGVHSVMCSNVNNAVPRLQYKQNKDFVCPFPAFYLVHGE